MKVNELLTRRKFQPNSLPVCTYSGQYVFDLMDTYGGGIAVFWVAIFETFIIMWVYGVQEFADDISFMVNATIGWYWRVSFNKVER